MKIILAIMGMAFILMASLESPIKAQASWAFGFVKWNQVIYRVTPQEVPSVGRQIGVITNYSTEETAKESGTFSNQFGIGAKLYSIPNKNVNQAISVRTGDGKYVEADAQFHSIPSMRDNSAWTAIAILMMMLVGLITYAICSLKFNR